MVIDQATLNPAQPNIYVTHILSEVEAVVGHDVLTLILVKAGLPHLINNFPTQNSQKDISFNKFSSLMQSIETQLGNKAGRKITRKAGKKVFPYILECYGKQNGVSKRVLDLVPEEKKLSIGLSALVKLSNEVGDQNLSLEEDTMNYYIRVERCATCWGRNHATEPVCDIFVGFLEAGVNWLCDGVNHAIKEIECKAQGDEACVFSISKRSL